MDETIEMRRKRAAWRAGHRGTKELDLLVGRFADARLAQMSESDLGHFERLLAVNEPELQAWLLGPAGGQGGEFAALVADIRRFHGLD